MRQHRLQFLFVAIILITLGLSCKSPSGPEPFKNPREYTWTVDTLIQPATFQRLMQGIWGSSAQDVYVAGHTAGPLGKMYHYDGVGWTPVKLHSLEGGPIPDVLFLGDLFGFSSKDIYAVGSKIGPSYDNQSSIIIHFDGIRWVEQPTFGGSLLQGVFGVSPTDIWAGGIRGSLFHYDGLSWKKFPMPDSIWFARFTGIASNEIYAIASTLQPFSLNTYYIFRWDGTTWNIEDSFKQSVFVEDKFGYRLKALNGKLYSVGYGVFEKTTAGWKRMFGNRSTNFIDMCGTSRDNFFAVGGYGLVYHYNGNDWFQYTQFVSDKIQYWGCWTDGREVFIIGNDGLQSYVLHGK